ncbi:type IV pilus assembly protein PilN [Andreprevotia lacus DSM 23236]|jgi:type IV pilus assembly protein PilN|uniref:Type IV pilus assembly protein PilN n=1 Tax=Andreprevotia lacus DSM 23236 TaxID=1121001 RepID=A0A1W1Y174_9NEIS|nr:PilN domain-containing protein [Andreprevotia lacus]SMC29896.1 type IV pilus assembly protein PilN [Andreprevotia lacus DSM 23236]
MIRINLLPHREQKRQARQHRYLALLGITVLIAIGVLVAGYMLYEARIETQNHRNDFLTEENAKLDREIAEIDKLKAEKQALLDRKKVVERLQSNRSETVRVMDQLTRQTPEGIYLKDVKQTDDSLVLNGYAQSNARVSTLMRNLNDSDVFEQPLLIEVKAAQVANQRLSEFTLKIKITRATDQAAGDASAPAGKPVNKGA